MESFYPDEQVMKLRFKGNHPIKIYYSQIIHDFYYFDCYYNGKKIEIPKHIMQTFELDEAIEYFRKMYDVKYRRIEVYPARKKDKPRIVLSVFPDYVAGSQQFFYYINDELIWYSYETYSIKNSFREAYKEFRQNWGLKNKRIKIL